MRFSLRMLVFCVALAPAQGARADFDELPPGKRAGYTALAVVENVVPIASTLAAPRCLQGYLACKLTFAGLSVLLAGEHLLMSGGADFDQTRGVLHRGLTGDWVVTPRHASGDTQPQVLPDPPPAATTAETPQP